MPRQSGTIGDRQNILRILPQRSGARRPPLTRSTQSAPGDSKTFERVVRQLRARTMPPMCLR
jgi:hypothetical protein